MMLHKKKYNQDLATYFFKKKIVSCEEVCLRFISYLKTFKAVHRNNPWTHSPQQNKKALLRTAAYFKVSTPVRTQEQ